MTLSVKDCESFMRSYDSYVRRSFEIPLSKVNTHSYENDTDRFRAWCAESLHAGMDAVRESLLATESLKNTFPTYRPESVHASVVLALRCLLQAVEYRGRLNWWPTPEMSDGHTMLKIHIEAHIKGAT